MLGVGSVVPVLFGRSHLRYLNDAFRARPSAKAIPPSSLIPLAPRLFVSIHPPCQVFYRSSRRAPKSKSTESGRSSTTGNHEMRNNERYGLVVRSKGTRTKQQQQFRVSTCCSSMDGVFVKRSRIFSSM